jgi:hypothetical protein
VPIVSVHPYHVKTAQKPKEPPSFMAKDKGDRIMFDIRSVHVLSQGQNPFHLVIMDDYINYCWSFFLPQKDDLPTMVKTGHLSI